MSTTILSTRSLLLCLAALAVPACAGASGAASPTEAPAQGVGPPVAQERTPESTAAADVPGDREEPDVIAEGEVTEVIEIGADAGPPPSVVSPPKRPPMPSMMSDVVMGPSR